MARHRTKCGCLHDGAAQLERCQYHESLNGPLDEPCPVCAASASIVKDARELAGLVQRTMAGDKTLTLEDSLRMGILTARILGDSK